MPKERATSVIVEGVILHSQLWLWKIFYKRKPLFMLPHAAKERKKKKRTVEKSLKQSSKEN